MYMYVCMYVCMAIGCMGLYHYVHTPWGGGGGGGGGYT